MSEKACGLDPVAGGLDLAHPAVKADLASPAEPVGVVRFVVEGLARKSAEIRRRPRFGLQPLNTERSLSTRANFKKNRAAALAELRGLCTE